MTVKQFFFSARGTGSTLGDLGLLILRLSGGLALAFAHGLGKLPPGEGFVSGVEKMGFPAPSFFAWAASFSEFAGALLVAIGLATRPAAALVACTMATAFFLRHGPDAFEKKEKAFTYLVIFVAIMLMGAGRFSIDAIIGGKGKK
ncbi:MAG: DoxX family protein [Armatimonadota bacterium]|nr:DoxX family protein [Armatimonadota bacterium]